MAVLETYTQSIEKGTLPSDGLSSNPSIFSLSDLIYRTITLYKRSAIDICATLPTFPLLRSRFRRPPPSMAATVNTSQRPFETLRTTGSDVRQDSFKTNFKIPFHGSCSSCHHFHINLPFTFTLDSSEHTRLFCERCNHPMFGLGRTSTQNTLASVESGSTFLPRVCADRLGQQQPAALQVETVSDVPRHGLLTTITERRSPVPSRSTSNVRSPTRTISTASLAGEETGGSIGQTEQLDTKSSAQERLDEQGLRPQLATLRAIGRRFRRRFCARPRGWKLPRIRLQITYAHGTSVTSASASATEVSSGQERPDDAEESGTGDTEDRHASLRARRRKLTLVRERDIGIPIKCECSPECPCNNGSHVVHVDRPETPDNILVPNYLFPHSSTGSSNSQLSQNETPGHDFLHIGRVFDTPRRSSSADESNSNAESLPRRIRASQGLPLWSPGSSVSLWARRPPVGRASSMPVGIRLPYLTSVRTGSHISSFNLASAQPEAEAAGAPASLDDGSVPGRTSRTESSWDHEASPHASSTSLTNLPNPQQEEQLVDGVSPPSHTPMPEGNEVASMLSSGTHLNGTRGEARGL